MSRIRAVGQVQAGGVVRVLRVDAAVDGTAPDCRVGDTSVLAHVAALHAGGMAADVEDKRLARARGDERGWWQRRRSRRRHVATTWAAVLAVGAVRAVGILGARPAIVAQPVRRLKLDHGAHDLARVQADTRRRLSRGQRGRRRRPRRARWWQGWRLGRLRRRQRWRDSAYDADALIAPQAR